MYLTESGPFVGAVQCEVRRAMARSSHWINHVRMHCDQMKTTISVGEGIKEDKRCHGWATMFKIGRGPVGVDHVLCHVIGLEECIIFSRLQHTDMFASLFNFNLIIKGGEIMSVRYEITPEVAINYPLCHP